MSSKFWSVPALIGVAFASCSYFVGPSLGKWISDEAFQKERSSYQTVVEQFKSGRAHCLQACNLNPKLIEGASPPEHVRFIWGAHCNTGGVILIFFQDTNEPLLHAGYLFKDYEDGSDCAKRFGVDNFVWSDLPYVRQLNGGWYRVADQPGL